MSLNLPAADLLETTDISTSATDFQEDGTATPGDTGRVADAGHVHPAGPLGYQIVTQDAPSGTIDVTLAAPTGYLVVGGGYSRDAGSDAVSWISNGPLADGTGWTFKGSTSDGDSTTLYAICVAA